MKIRTGADWRDALPFDIPVPAAEAAPGDAARCAGCPADTEPWPREALWALKHRHPNNPAGYVRFYCADHKPKPALRAPEPAAKARRERRAAVPKPQIPERVAALCPDCFIEVPPTGVCGMCGQRVG